jgi:predicted permease
LLVDGRVFEKNSEPGARVRFVYGDYLGALGLRVVEGRGFVSTDNETGEPVAILNQRLARELFPNRTALGGRVSWRDWNPHQQTRWMRIVGITEDVKGVRLQDPDSRTIFAPYLQRPQEWVRWGTLVVRTKADPSTLLPAVRRAVWSVDPTLPLANVQQARELVRHASAQERFNAFALSLFSGTALLLALQGVYGILAFLVEQRRRELGVRMALGASSGDVLRLVVGNGLRLVGGGLAIGAALAWLSRPLIASLLFGVSATDTLTYAATALALALAGALASALPARRAGRVDPMTVLRAD